jgi:hypothetical protein
MTIYLALKRKLGREPTHAELKADVKRIISEANDVQADKEARRRSIPGERP